MEQHHRTMVCESLKEIPYIIVHRYEVLWLQRCTIRKTILSPFLSDRVTLMFLYQQHTLQFKLFPMFNSVISSGYSQILAIMATGVISGCFAVGWINESTV